jgi:hypothetical protein
MVQAAIFAAIFIITGGLIYEIHGPKERNPTKADLSPHRP